MSGATRYTKNPKELLIAKAAADVIEHSSYFNDDFSMQMGSGGVSRQPQDICAEDDSEELQRQGSRLAV